MLNYVLAQHARKQGTQSLALNYVHPRIQLNATRYPGQTHVQPLEHYSTFPVCVCVRADMCMCGCLLMDDR
jgi:hypothetical protein